MNIQTMPNSNISGIKNKWRLFVSILIISSIVSTLTYFILKNALDTTTEHQALVFADIIARQAADARTVYSKYVASKLKRDGFGAHINSDNIPGHVPLPAQFLKLMGQESSKTNAKLFRYKPISKWHLEPTQGLNDNFENWAWHQLESQDQTAPTGPINWQPAWWTEVWQGEKYFRYLRADPASGQSCVTCHNEYLQKQKIKDQLQSDGIYELKQWKQHQLMGAISVTIPLKEIELIALNELQQTIVWTSTILVTALIIIGGIIISNTSPNIDRQKLLWSETHESESGLLSLTGLEQIIGTAIDTAKQSKFLHAFICLKFEDNFQVKNQFGVKTYNKLRIGLAKNITKSLRHNDALGWLSADKLAILIFECNSDFARRIIKQLQGTILKTEITVNGKKLRLDAIISLTMITKDTSSVSSIIKSTDRIDNEAISTTN